MKDTELIYNKVTQGIQNRHLRTIDLFAGCGGMSLGFDRAGFKSVAAVELNPAARKSHELNLASPRTISPFQTLLSCLLKKQFPICTEWIKKK